MRSLKEIALDLLEKYEHAQSCCIEEYSTDFRKDYDELADYFSAIKAEIEGSERDLEQRTRRLIKKAYKAGQKGE